MEKRSSLDGAFIVFKALVATPATDVTRTVNFVAINLYEADEQETTDSRNTIRDLS